MSPRDFWAPATVRAQQEARRQHANLGLWPLRLAGGQVSSTAGKYYMLSNVCELVRKGNDNPLPKCLPSDDDDGGGGRGPAHGAPHDASTADDAFAELADAPPLARARRTYSATGRDSGGGGSGGGGSGGGGASQPNADGVAEWLPLAQGPAGGANASRAAFTLLDLGSVPSNDNFLFDFALGGSGDDDGNDQDGPRGIDGDGLPGIDGHGLPGIDGDGLHGTDGDGLHGTDGDGQHGLHDDSDEDGQDGLVSSDDEGDAAVQRFLGNSKKL